MFEFSKSRVWVSRFAVGVGFLLLLVAPAFAQTESARIVGNVTDAGGAALPGATITVTDLGTSRAVTVNADEDGAYSVTNLAPGRYRLEITQSGFKTTRQEVTLEVQQVATLDFALETGGVSEVIEVTADAPLVESSTSAIGESIRPCATAW